MTSRHYESLVIINAAIEEDQIEAVLKRIEETINVNGGEITETEKWGRKRLAYPIEKAKSGYYALYRFTAPSNLIEKLERVYSLDEYILRYLTIVLDKRALEFLANQKAKAKEEVQEEGAAEKATPSSDVKSDEKKSENVETK